MASLRALYQNTAAQRFRAAIRPSLVGRLKYIEPDIAVRAADELGQWMVRVVEETMRNTRLKDNKGAVRRSLMAGIRLYGRRSLSNLRADIKVYPWLIAQEYGAHITKKDKYLTIPLFYALRPDGSPKFKSARSWQRFGSFVYTQKSTGRKFLAYKSASGELRILYILLDEVDIKPVLGLIRTAGSMLDELMSVWGSIYLSEAVRAGVFELWDGVL